MMTQVGRIGLLSRFAGTPDTQEIVEDFYFYKQI